MLNMFFWLWSKADIAKGRKNNNKKKIKNRRNREILLVNITMCSPGGI